MIRLLATFVLLLSGINCAQAACSSVRIQYMMGEAEDAHEVERPALICVHSMLQDHPPLVLAYHGRGSTPRAFERVSRIDQLWPDAVVVFMQGETGSPLARFDPQGLYTGWQSHAGDQGDRDLAYTQGVIDLVRGAYKIDRKRIFAVGHSNGALFMGVLWAKMPDTFRAFGIYAAPFMADRVMGQVPKPVFYGIGMTDMVVPPAEQVSSLNGIRSVLRVVSPRTPMPEIGKWSETGKAGEALSIYLHAGGHEWPEGLSRALIDFFKGQK